MQESQAHPVIWFLKSEKLGPAGEADPYRQAFTEANFSCFFLPVLGFNYINQDQLDIKLKSISSYSGIIFTSQRAVSAVEKLQAEVCATFPQNFPIFAVGEATASEARKVLPTCVDSVFVSDGNATQMSQDLKIRHEHTPFLKPLLFLSGNIRRDELPSAMRDAGIPFEELHVYETVRQGIDTTQDPLCSSTLSSYPTPKWIVFFSPSGVESFLHLLPRQENPAFWSGTLRASIGKTTASAMHAEGAWMEPHATATFPNPQSLLEAISNAK